MLTDGSESLTGPPLGRVGARGERTRTCAGRSTMTGRRSRFAAEPRFEFRVPHHEEEAAIHQTREHTGDRQTVEIHSLHLLLA